MQYFCRKKTVNKLHLRNSVKVPTALRNRKPKLPCLKKIKMDDLLMADTSC
jgi:hypothetical protein